MNGLRHQHPLVQAPLDVTWRTRVRTGCVVPRSKVVASVAPQPPNPISEVRRGFWAPLSHSGPSATEPATPSSSRPSARTSVYFPL
jgi:hypothetical protein